MKYFDTHAHYNDEVYEANLDAVLEKCKEAGVENIINIGYDKDSSQKAIQLANTYSYMYAAIGVHPHDVFTNTAAEIETMYYENDTSKIVAIGEIGLDYAFVIDNKKEQAALFHDQIDLANQLQLPVIIHTRDAALDTYEILKSHQPQYGLLFHCFHPTDDLVRMVLEKGYMVAFGGNITYKRNQTFAKYIQMIPIEQMVLETDCPYLSPEPYRGTVNSSANLPIIGNKLAEYKGISAEIVADTTFENAQQFFHIPH